MNIILSGYGKMGREIEQIALQNKHSISAIVDGQKDWEIYQNDIANSDVIIDFSQPDVVVANIKKAIELKIPIVVGTTGWDKEKEAIFKLCETNGQAIFTASNFSIGVNVFFEINTMLARLMNEYPQYYPSIEEIHHIQKLDKPSGTAIELAKQMLDHLNRKNKYTLEKENDPSDLVISAKRIEDIPGTHQVTYVSEVDKIEIKHTAFSRKGFAIGAVMAAEWLIGKKGCFGMKDLLGII